MLLVLYRALAYRSGIAGLFLDLMGKAGGDYKRLVLMSLNDLVSIIAGLGTIVSLVVGALIYLTRKPEKKVVFMVSIATIVVIVCVLGISVVISGATGGNNSSTAQSTGPANTVTTVPQAGSPTNTVTTVPPTVVTSSPTTVHFGGGDAASVMKNFCDDINSGDIQGAYALTSSSYQAQQSIADFRNQFNDADISKGGCLYDTPQVSNSTATVKLTFDKLDISNGTTSTTTYTVTLIQDPQNNNEWRINSIQ